MADDVETTCEHDLPLLRRSFAVAESARASGNHPFGAVLACADGHVLLEAENTVLTSGDRTAHAERNLLSLASSRFSEEELRQATLYASTEPCSMCATAARWVGVGRIVYGLSQHGLRNFNNSGPSKAPNDFSCREVFAFSTRPVPIVGPLLEDEARVPHEGFWS